MTASLVIDTLAIALKQKQPNEPVLFHSDQGCQYTSVAFRQFLDAHNLVAAYFKPGYPYDNAVIESFFKYLKRDELSRRSFYSLEKVSLSTFSYIEGWYNNRRPHSHNKMLTPNEKEDQFYLI